MRIAVYPGSFDPLTNGHLDVIERASRQFDKLIVSVARNPSKNPLFSEEERVDIIKHATKDIPNVEVGYFDGLLTDSVESIGANTIIKGLRAMADFEYEFQMALMNRHLNPHIETMFLMTHSKYAYLSSSMVKEVFMLGGDISELVIPYVKNKLKEKFQNA
jgi:pantetheine-phosphate adenylyltransferase